MTTHDNDIESLALASFLRRAKRLDLVPMMPSASSTTVDEKRKRVVLRNVNGPLAALTYRDDGHRVVFRSSELEPGDDNW